MYRLLSIIPLLLFALIGALHAYSVANPSEMEMSAGYWMLYGVVFACVFGTVGVMAKHGLKVHAANVYVAHLHAGRVFGAIAYTACALSLALFMLSLGAEFDPRRRSTALWMVLLSCPAVVWWRYMVSPLVTKSRMQRA